MELFNIVYFFIACVVVGIPFGISIGQNIGYEIGLKKSKPHQFNETYLVEFTDGTRGWITKEDYKIEYKIIKSR